MAKIKAGNIEKGMYLLHQNQPYKVVHKKFVSPGKGSAFTRAKMQNLETGAIISYVFKSHDRVDEIYVESKQMQFLYQSGDQVFFMNPQTYKQVSIPKSVVGDQVAYLVAELQVYILFYEDKPMVVRLPPKVTMKVLKANAAVAGDRQNSGTKSVTMETGLEVQAPLFIEQGEKLVISTDTGEYVSRAN
ncbi:MAG: elongation factor P [Patescibacteria group bacterium]|nr:elongation factor P [Patescibacteria group bacterium]